jgi:negative modulator of initiation of replication
MKIVKIDDDIYEFLRQQSDFEETINTVLRRFLKVPVVSNPPATANGDKTGGSPVMRLIGERSFVVRNATDKVLRILSAAHNRVGEKGFSPVLDLSGRHRKWFGRSADEIEASGTNTKPQQIPGTTYWVMTNAANEQKRMMVKKALQVLGYLSDEIEAVAKAIF